MIPWWRIVLAFLFCIALAVAAILVVRRRLTGGSVPTPWLAGLLPPARATPPSQPDLIGRLRLSATSQVVALHWEETRYLIHVCAAGAELLDRRPAGDPAP